MKNTTAALTITDLENTLEDERHEGYGFAAASTRRLGELSAAYTAVVERANALGWDYEALFTWSNSKAGRWFWDQHTYSLESALKLVAA